tara:strand:+ start:15720 stop:16193 length:474 start_codon:yes stop_codon:yes gene_type:complete
MIKVLYDKLKSNEDKELIWKDTTNNEIYNMYTQHIKYIKPVLKEDNNIFILEKNLIKKAQKKEIIKPIELILKETNNFDDFANEIKDKLIKFISQKEFNKVFGATKNSEIMSGIVNNRWNKSTAIFVSFILGKKINYNGKIIAFDKEKYKDTVEFTI